MNHCHTIRNASVVLTICGLVPVVSSAHDFWIDPDRFSARSGEEISLTLRQGVSMKGDSLPYLTPLIENFSQTDSSGRRAIESVMGNDPAGVIELAAGDTLVGYQSNRDFVALEPAKFLSYLEDEGLDDIISERTARGRDDEQAREYFVRCAKLLLRTIGDDPRTAYRFRLGYTLELMPVTDPYALAAGDSLRLQLLYVGQPIAGVRVRAFTEEDPESFIDQRSDAGGYVVFDALSSGTWLIKAVHMIHLDDDERADWESFWASLLFQIG